MRLNVKINGMDRVLDIEPSNTLYEVLKKYDFVSVKKSCGTASCGVCTVLLDDKPIPSCSYLAAKAAGHEITTIEGVKDEADKLGRIMNEEGAIQCGFCSPGFLLTVIAMKNELRNPTEEDIKSYLVGNLCRCSGYQGQMRAIKCYMGVLE